MGLLSGHTYARLILGPQKDFQWSKTKVDALGTEARGNDNSTSAPGSLEWLRDLSPGFQLFLLPLKVTSSHITLLTDLRSSCAQVVKSVATVIGLTVTSYGRNTCQASRFQRKFSSSWLGRGRVPSLSAVFT